MQSSSFLVSDPFFSTLPVNHGLVQSKTYTGLLASRADWGVSRKKTKPHTTTM